MAQILLHYFVVCGTFAYFILISVFLCFYFGKSNNAPIYLTGISFDVILFVIFCFSVFIRSWWLCLLWLLFEAADVVAAEDDDVGYFFVCRWFIHLVAPFIKQSTTVVFFNVVVAPQHHHHPFLNGLASGLSFWGLLFHQNLFLWFARFSFVVVVAIKVDINFLLIVLAGISS